MFEYSCIAVHFPKCADHNRYGYAEAQHVAARLTYDYPLQTEEIWKYDNERNEEQSLPCRRQDVCTQRLAGGLEHHVACHGECVERIGGKLPAQCRRAYPYHLRVVAEYTDGTAAEKESCKKEHKKKRCAHFHGETEALTQTSVKPRAITEAAERLDMKHHGLDKVRITVLSVGDGKWKKEASPCATPA